MGALFLLVCGSRAALAAAPDYSVFLHITTPDYSGCALEDADLSCAGIVFNAPSWGPSVAPLCWVLVGNVPAATEGSGGIGSLAFGIVFEKSVSMDSWTLCTSGVENPQADGAGTWPGSYTGNSVTWGEGCSGTPVNADGIVKVGYFGLAAGSRGLLNISDDPRGAGNLIASDCGGFDYPVCLKLWGSACVTPGGTLGYSPCGVHCLVPVEETTWGTIKARYSD